MKNLNSLLMTILFLVFGISKASAESIESFSKNYKVKSFRSVYANTLAHIVYTQSDKVSVKVEGAQEMVDLLQISVSKGMLTIENDKELNNNKDEFIIIYVSSPTIESIETHGMGNFNLLGKVKSENLIIKSEGIGSFQALDLESKKICVKYGAIGDLKISGKTDLIEINSEGVGNIDCKDLVAKTAMVKSTKTGKVKCFASESVGVFNEGIGEITYHGSPTFKNLQNSGMGEINEGLKTEFK